MKLSKQKLKKIRDTRHKIISLFSRKREGFTGFRTQQPLNSLSILKAGSFVNDFRRFDSIKINVERKNFTEAKKDEKRVLDELKDNKQELFSSLRTLFSALSKKELSETAKEELKVYYVLTHGNIGIENVLAGRYAKAQTYYNILSDDRLQKELLQFLKGLFYRARISPDNMIKGLDVFSKEEFYFNLAVLGTSPFFLLDSQIDRISYLACCGAYDNFFKEHMVDFAKQDKDTALRSLEILHKNAEAIKGTETYMQFNRFKESIKGELDRVA